jgi:FtsZ-interacting cell division protein ZipA
MKYMSELRWILLVAGGLLVAALLLVGLLRSRQAAGARRELEPRRMDEPTLGELPDVETIVDAEPGNPVPQILLPKLPPALPPALQDLPVRRLFEGGDPAPAERPAASDWPPAEQRAICSLRIVPAHQDRLSGRSIRQGLQSAGFVHGDLGIFHLAARADRAMLSAASMAKPGQLDPVRMDYQRFSGLSIFTILPGRVAADLALEQLYEASVELARRVNGQLQDDSGRPLDPTQLDGWIARSAAAARPQGGAASRQGAATLRA